MKASVYMKFEHLMLSHTQARSFYERVKAKLDFAARSEQRGFGAIRKSYYRAYWNAVAASYDARIDEIGYNILRISKGEHFTFVRDHEVMLDDHLSLNMMGNKPLTHQLLMEKGHPVPRHLVFTMDTLEQANEFRKKLGKLVVVKPSGGGAGRGVTTKIGGAKELKKAARSAAVFHSRLLIEEQIEGASYRLLYLDGRLIDIVRRDAPRVIGDGVNSIQKLISRENTQRLEGRDVSALSPIVVDIDCKTKLSEQSLRLNDIPDDGRIVIVKDVINQNSAKENHVIPETGVHPSTIAMGREIAVDLGLELIGLDIMSEDISLPLRENGGVINEINTTPGLHHHDLVSERMDRANVAPQILDYIFAK